MFIVVQHQISNPERFWEEAQLAVANLPAGMKVHSTLPNSDGTKAVCIWEAGEMNGVKDAIESSVGQFSKNEYFSVDFAYNYSSCAAMGSISERESNLGAYKEILWAKDELFDIMGLAKYLKWDTSNTVIEDLSEKV